MKPMSDSFVTFKDEVILYLRRIYIFLSDLIDLIINTLIS